MYKCFYNQQELQLFRLFYLEIKSLCVGCSLLKFGLAQSVVAFKFASIPVEGHEYEWSYACFLETMRNDRFITVMVNPLKLKLANFFYVSLQQDTVTLMGWAMPDQTRPKFEASYTWA